MLHITSSSISSPRPNRTLVSAKDGEVENEAWLLLAARTVIPARGKHTSNVSEASQAQKVAEGIVVHAIARSRAEVKGDVALEVVQGGLGWHVCGGGGGGWRREEKTRVWKKRKQKEMKGENIEKEIKEKKRKKRNLDERRKGFVRMVEQKGFEGKKSGKLGERVTKNSTDADLVLEVECV